MQTFTVKGKAPWSFPLDMLRHDSAYPKTIEDADKIESVLSDLNDHLLQRMKDKNGYISITFETERLSNITPRRWESYRWTVEAEGHDTSTKHAITHRILAQRLVLLERDGDRCRVQFDDGSGGNRWMPTDELVSVEAVEHDQRKEKS